MATIELPEKQVFDQRVQDLQARIDGITQGNTMAMLLNNNFKKWLSKSSMSPIKLTKELDANEDGIISGDEFGDLLGRMTGERPPEWVVELVFSFVNADAKRGMPLDDWMAFLAASGLVIPDELFQQKIEVTGTVAVLENEVDAGSPFSVTASFNTDVEAYQIVITDRDSNKVALTQDVAAADMDRPNFDEFELTIPNEGNYVLQLVHLGARLDTHDISVLPQMEETAEVNEPSPIEVLEQEAVEEEIETVDGFEGFIQTLEAAKLRSEAQGLMADAPAFMVSSTVTSVSRTLLGMGFYRNGYTLHCTAEEGYSFRVMLKPCEQPPAAGDRFDGGVLMHDWDVALKQAICLEA